MILRGEPRRSPLGSFARAVEITAMGLERTTAREILIAAHPFEVLGHGLATVAWLARLDLQRAALAAAVEAP